MERTPIVQKLIVAAGTAGKVSVAPPDSTRKWKIVSVTELPNATSAADGTNYCTRTPKVGSTAIATAITTASTAITAGTAVSWTLTGVGATLEATQANPFTHSVAHSGTGVAYDCSVMVEVEEVRV